MDGKLKMPQTATYIPICRTVEDEAPQRFARPRRHPMRVLLPCTLIFACAVAAYRPDLLARLQADVLTLRPTLEGLGTRTRDAVEAFAQWGQAEPVWNPAEPAATTAATAASPAEAPATTAATTAAINITYHGESPAPDFPAAETGPKTVSSDPDAAADWPEIVTASVTVPGFDYTLPVAGRVSSDFGYRDHPVDGENKFHYGVDIAASEGTPIQAFADGTVIYAGVGEINGNYLKIRHEDGYVSLYAHLSEIGVEWGQTVKKGDCIGKVGQTGKVTGPHLHLQLYHEGQLFDPMLLLGDAAGA